MSWLEKRPHISFFRRHREFSAVWPAQAGLRDGHTDSQRSRAEIRTRDS